MTAVLRLVRGVATPEELAAVVMLLTARAAPPAPAPEPAAELWSRPVLRGAVHPGPDAWRASGLR